jgi:hypothetical protein
MSHSFDKFMDRITQDEANRRLNEEHTHNVPEERLRDIDPNRLRIMGREHWQNRTRGTWVRR